ncbi:hypothetical protein D3C75_547010 [compost metagenome]
MDLNRDVLAALFVIVCRRKGKHISTCLADSCIGCFLVTVHKSDLIRTFRLLLNRPRIGQLRLKYGAMHRIGNGLAGQYDYAVVRHILNSSHLADHRRLLLRRRSQLEGYLAGAGLRPVTCGKAERIGAFF